MAVESHPNVEGNDVRVGYRVPHTFAVFANVWVRAANLQDVVFITNKCDGHRRHPNHNHARIPRQCSIENCPRLQRRTHHPPQNHSRRLFDKQTISRGQVDEKQVRSSDPAPREVHAKTAESTAKSLFM
jgi:hypothetical protein